MLLSLLALFDEQPLPMLIVGPDSRLLQCNSAASALLRVDGPLGAQYGVLRLNGLPVTSCLESSDGRFVTTFHQGKSPPTRRVLVARSMQGSKADPVVVLVYAPHDRPRISADILQQVYGLTRAEATTAVLLFQGRRLSEIATELSVSTETVRSHVKKTFLKCEVRSQAALIRLLALGPGIVSDSP